MVDFVEDASGPRASEVPKPRKVRRKLGNSNAFKCEQCQETFPTLGTMRKHEKFYHLFSKPFACECGQQFGKRSEANYHIRRVHNKERNYVCQECNKAFFKNSDLVIHKSVHEPSAKFICEDCGRRFKHVSNLIRHSRIHTGIKPYLCMPCDKRFSQIAALRQHEITEKHKEKVSQQNAKGQHDTSKNEQTEYNPCDEDTTEPKNASTTKKEEAKKKWWFYCKVCGERFPFSVLLRDHETKHLANKDIRCNSCKAEFSSLKAFNNHGCTNDKESEADADQIEAQPEEVQCGDFLQEEAAVEDQAPEGLDEGADVQEEKEVALTLTQDGQIMLNNDEVLLTVNDKVYGLLLINNDVTAVEKECLPPVLSEERDDGDLCDAPDMTNIDHVLNAEEDLQATNLMMPDEWMWMDEDVTELRKVETFLSSATTPATTAETKRGHTCMECDKVFYKKRAYLEHIGSHSKTPQKHKCPECPRYFSWNSSLRNHILKKHSKKTEYSCLRCGKTYFSSLLVEHHVKRDHLNIRSYKCEVCRKAFFRRYDLKIHSRIHTNERPYICGMCGKTFRHLSHSIRHDRTHLNDDAVDDLAPKLPLSQLISF